MRLDDDMRRLVREQSLGFVATVCPDGTPNLSPKGTTIVWGDEHLAFLHLHSPGTVANLATNPAIEINVVDPIVRKGYRFKGHAEVMTEGALRDEILEFYRRERGTDIARAQAVVVVRVDSAAPVVSPAYDAGATEEEVVTRWTAHHLNLATRLRSAAAGPATDSKVRLERLAAGVVEGVAAQAREADLTRTVSRDAVEAIKGSGLLALSASVELGGAGGAGGAGGSVADVAAELEMLAAACASTAWCVWNHLCVFHLFCGALGPDHTDLLAGIVERREWVCFPAGAGSGVHAIDHGEHLALDGPAAFGSGARYADWAGVAFAMADSHGTVIRPLDMRFSIVRLDTEGVEIRPTWDGSGLRASATDDVVYRSVGLPATRAVPWYGANRAAKLRDPDFAVISPRYREDWVGLSDVWLAAMGTGVVGAALDEVASEVGGRKALMGRPMTELAGVHFNLGRAAKELAGARAAVTHTCDEVDARIAAATVPTEADELRLAAVSAFALEACDRAMHHLLKVVGGNGLRERHPFERRHRDFQPMPLHINAHEDRVTERFGRHLLGLPLDKF